MTPPEALQDSEPEPWKAENQLSPEAAEAVFAFLDIYAPLVRPGGKIEAIVATETLGRCQAPLLNMIRALVAWREERAV